MTKCPYVGANETARRVRKLYIGVDGVARKVKRAYVGIDNVARLFYTSEFFLPKGVNLNNVIAAYQFKGAKNQQDALIDRTGHGYNLSASNMSWDQENGLLDGEVTNTNLANLNKAGGIITQVICYGKYTGGSGINNNYALTAMGLPALSLYNRNDYRHHGGDEEDWYDGEGQIGMITFAESGEYAGHYEEYGGNLATDTYATTNGVIAGTVSDLWLNGTKVANTRSWGGRSYSSGNPFSWIKGGTRVVVANHSYIYAAAFYNINLTNDQHIELSRTMSEVKA